MATDKLEVPSNRYGTYVLKSRLGSGAQAEVFLAEAVDERGDQMKVALKMMRPGIDEESFAHEADLMGLLTHPNLVRMYEAGRAFGRAFIAMEFLVGGDLRGVMESHRKQLKGVPATIGVHVMIEVLRALAYFHQAKTLTGTPLNLVHNDVNPSNVFFAADGEVKIGDFGVAQSIQAQATAGVAVGKLSYLSPEQTRGEPVTAQSDLWSVGVMLHELVVGYHPFREEGADEQQTMAAIRAAKLVLPDYVEKPLAAILQRALAPDAKGRYRSAGELAGPLFTWLLDRGGGPTKAQVLDWLQHTLGLVV